MGTKYPTLDLSSGDATFVNPRNQNSSFRTSSLHSNSDAAHHHSLIHSSSSSLRAVIGEKFRVAPPVPVPNSLLSPPSTSAAEPKNDLDFSYERRILRELDASKRMVPVIENREMNDWFQDMVNTCTCGGYSKEEATFGLAIALTVSGQQLTPKNVMNHASSYRHLRNMGFDSNAAMGSLVMEQGNMNAAIDLALSLKSVK